ncbi:MAG: hypothetical protein ACQESA_03020 [Patescibacteria group bacterium]
MSEGCKEDGRVVKLCGDGGCCPAVDLTNPEEVTIVDDFGGVVILSRDQWRELLERFK